MLDAYGGGMNVSMKELAAAAFKSPEYNLIDYLRWIKGANRGSGNMWEEYIKLDLFDDVPEIDIPVFFLAGKNDYNTPLSLTEKYMDYLDAPRGKFLTVFNESGHAPFITEKDKFNREVNSIKYKLTPQADDRLKATGLISIPLDMAPVN